MFDLGWTELLVIGVVALIVVGPKDLPGMFRTLGRFTGKMKNMAREFQRAMNDAADEAGVKDISKDLKNATSAKSMGLDKLNAAADRFEKWEPTKPKPKVGAEADKGPETQKLSEERAAQAKKIRDSAAQKAEERKAAEVAASAAEMEAEPEPDAPANTTTAEAPAAKAKPATKPKPAAKAKPAATSTAKSDTKPAAKSTAKSGTKTASKSTAKTGTKSGTATKPAAKPKTTAKSKTTAKPKAATRPADGAGDDSE